MTDLWNNADPDAAGFDDLTLDPPEPDGDYTIQLDDTYVGISEKGNAFISLTFKDVATEYRWKHLMTFAGKTPEKAQAAANRHKAYVRAMGIEVEHLTFDELGKALAQQAGHYFHVRVKTNGEFRNTHMEGPAQPASSDATPAPSPAPAGQAVPADDSIPF